MSSRIILNKNSLDHMQRLTLNNGTRVLLLPFSGTEAASFFVLFNVGSRYEYPAINGAAHFIEHLMFKGTKRRPRTLDISRTLDAVGAEFNAYTSKDSTGYYVKADATHLPLAIDLLHDMLFHSTFAPKEVKRERGVIIEEINMYHDNPLMFVEDLLEQTMFEGSTLGWEVTGSPQTMRSMTRKAVMEFHKSHYIPSRMVVAVAGKLSPKTLAQIKRTFGSVPKSGDVPTAFGAFPGIFPRSKPRVNVHYKATKQIQIAFGFPSFGIDDKRNSAVTLLATILGGTMSSRLFISVRERRGLAYRVGASLSSYQEVGAFVIHAGLDRTRLPLATKTIMNEVRKVLRNGVTAREVREAKDHVHGKLLLRFEDSSSRAEWYASQELLMREAKTFEQRLKELEKVTPADIKNVAREIFDFRRLSVATIGPYRNEQAFLKAANL